MNNDNLRWLIERYHSQPVQHGLAIAHERLRPLGGWLKTWSALALMLAFALLFSFYAAVSAVAKRAEQQRLLDSQRAQAYWRCDALPGAQRRECQANVISASATQRAPREGAKPVQLATARN